MRVAVISDVHANLQAWNAVLIDIRSLKIDTIICLGDVIGYGPDPAEVLESLYANVNYFVLGNHDAALAGLISDSLFHDRARRSLAWTRSRLNSDAAQVFKKFPLTITGDGFRCAHGDLGAPELFNYVIEPSEALASWTSTHEQLLFVGHSHQPGIYLLGASGNPHRIDPQDFAIENGKRYLVNVGSVGCPRHGTPQATYCIYDMKTRTVYWRSIPFDLDGFRHALDKAGLDDSNSHFLQKDPRRATVPLRPQLGFKPPSSKNDGAATALPGREIALLKRQAQFWRRTAIGGVLVVLVIALLALRRIQSGSMPTPHHIADPHINTVDGTSFAPDENILALFTGHPIDVHHPLKGWTLSFYPEAKQSVTVTTNTSPTPQLRFTSAAVHEIHLASMPIVVSPGQKFSFTAACRKSPDFSGTMAFSISLTQDARGKTTTSDYFVVKEPSCNGTNGWHSMRKLFTTPPGSTMIQVHWRGRFKGSVDLPSIFLCSRPAKKDKSQEVGQDHGPSSKNR